MTAVNAWKDIEPAAEAASARVAFQLTYARSPVPRRFSPGFLTGPSIPCAYGGVLDASGDWEDGDDLNHFHPDRSETEWVDRYAGYTVAEAVHEALEWFRVDGKPWLDPHGPSEELIHGAVREFVAQLAEIRKEANA